MSNIIVLFEVSLKKEEMQDYLQQAAALKTLLINEEGFISAERFSSLTAEGKLLSMSIWRDEESVARWRNNLSHRMSQKSGRMENFVDYKITVVSPLRSYTMNERQEAPKDSNQYFDV